MKVFIKTYFSGVLKLKNIIFQLFRLVNLFQFNLFQNTNK